MPERTPSLTSRASASSSAGPVSPIDQPQTYMSYDPRESVARSQAFHLPPPSGLWRKVSSGPETLPSIRMHAGGVKRSESEVGSPRHDLNGLDMLLDAGRRVETRME